MVDCAAHWVDDVIPHVPVRQWVLSLPAWLRYRVTYNSDLCSRVLGFFIHATMRWYRHTAKRYLKLPPVNICGAKSCDWFRSATPGAYVMDRERSQCTSCS
jgi:hypothetical protein